MKLVRHDPIDDGEELNEMLNDSGEGLAEFLWNVINRELLADNHDQRINRYIVMAPMEEQNLRAFAQKLLGKNMRKHDFLEMLMKTFKSDYQGRLEVTYRHVDHGDNDPTLLMIWF